MNVLFAPDWRDGVPYQRLLAEALADHGVRVAFLRDYKRGLPLARLVRERAREERVDVLHLHWPEAYYPSKGDALDWFRFARYPLDLALARCCRSLVVTAHNLHAHNRPDEPFARRNTAASLTQAQRVIAHSEPAKAEIVASFGVAWGKIRVIPHGDLSVPLGPPLERTAARAKLGLGTERVVIIFGAVEPYKGIEDVLDFWRAAKPAAKLIVIGRPNTPEYGAAIATRAEGVAEFRAGWLTDADLREWLSATDAVLFNYRAIFTSGAACLARSCGVPILIPSRLATVELDEPSPFVLRFSDLETDLPRKLEQALQTKPDYDAAAPWREATAWPRIAAATAEVYREALAK
jgi:glycosyltransferase involved in cell wall biosynthesis